MRCQRAAGRFHFERDEFYLRERRLSAAFVSPRPTRLQLQRSCAASGDRPCRKGLPIDCCRTRCGRLRRAVYVSRARRSSCKYLLCNRARGRCRHGFELQDLECRQSLLGRSGLCRELDGIRCLLWRPLRGAADSGWRSLKRHRGRSYARPR